MERRGDTLDKLTDLTILIHLPTITEIHRFVKKHVKHAAEGFKHEEAWQHFVTALQTALKSANVNKEGIDQEIKGARYALGIAGNGSAQDVATEYSYVHDQAFHEFWHGARYIFVGDPEEVQKDAPVQMVKKIENAVFKHDSAVADTFISKVVVELPYKGKAEEMKAHYAEWKTLVHKREKGGLGVHGLVPRAHTSDLIVPADKFLIEMRDEFRLRDGVPEAELRNADNGGYGPRA